MPIEFRIDQITFSGSEEPVAVGDSDLVVLIGPNNAGKSAALREIREHVADNIDGVVIENLAIRRDGTEAEFIEWALEVASLRAHGEQIVGWHTEMHFPNAKAMWAAGEKLGALTDLLILSLNAEARLGLSGSVQSIDRRTEVPRAPLQRLLADPSAEARLSDGVKAAYGEPVSVNRAGGSMLHLLLGRAVSEPRLDNETYMEEIESLPLVSDQGDGVRSFIGLLLAIEAAPYPVVLVDEPEAFLHPPQAREIGRRCFVVWPTMFRCNSRLKRASWTSGSSAKSDHYSVAAGGRSKHPCSSEPGSSKRALAGPVVSIFKATGRSVP